uniref:CRISPR-associated endonuclease Cas2 n=1 Tax=Eubacterium sp. TaxID=142586 RepID=UPI0040262A6B
MRVIAFFDLPVDTTAHRREYARFRKFLIKSGFVMMQQSVYVKLAINQNASKSICDSVRKNKPSSGIVQLLTITEKQFQKMEFVNGGFTQDVVMSDERLIIL